MRILRSSMYPPPGGGSSDPVTVIVRDCDVTGTLEEAAAHMEMPGTFVVNDIFEADDLDQVRAALLAAHRLRDSTRATEEHSMAVSYYWNAMQLPRIRPFGMLGNPKPSPLSEEQIETVLRQLMKHPDYQKQTIICIARNMVGVILFGSGNIRRQRPGEKS